VLDLDYHDDGATSCSEMLLTIYDLTWRHRALESYAMCTDTFHVKKTITFGSEYKIQPLGK
jgi:hypothetical protein